MSSLYLRDDLTPEDSVPGALLELRGEEAHHALAVSRTRVGEQIAVGDGRGLIVRGSVASAADGVLTLRVERSETVERPRPALVLVQALAKGGRDELAIQAATELGVEEIVPWSAQRSVTRWTAAKTGRGRERWRSIVREAAKQSIRAWVPDVAPVAGLDGLRELCGRARVVVLEPTAAVALTDLAWPALGEAAAHARIALVVGPEGGVAPDELTGLSEAGAESARLGGSVLRTSTAGPAALAALNVLLGRW